MKKKSGKILQAFAYVLVIICMVISIGIARNCGRFKSSANLTGYSKGDTLDIAILYGPGSIYLYSDTLSGLNSEISRAYSSSTSTPVKIWPVADASVAMEGLKNGAFDILASLPLDNIIKKEFLTSESIFLDRLVLLQLKDSISGSVKVNSSLDLNGKEIHVASGSTAVTRLSNLSKEIGGGINIIEETELSDELLCLKVASGDIDYAVVNEKIAKHVAQKYPNLSYANPVSFTQFQVWLFNSSDTAGYEKFSGWFDVFRQEDTYRELINRF